MSRNAKLGLFVAVLALALGVAPPAFAGLSAVGVSPNFNSVTTSNGFPQWYTDANGFTVDLPVPPAGDGLNAPTMIYQALDVGSNAVAQRAGFDTEAFYFNARADPKDFKTAYGKVVVTLGLEASYGTGTPTDGQQVVFARIRIKAPVTVAGTYTFSHPWGVETIVVTPADIAGTNKGIFFTKDFGLSTGWNPDGSGGWLPVAAPGGFYSVLQSGNIMSTFLRAVSPAPPAGWIGDGATLSTVTGSPTGYNKVRLEGPDPDLGGVGIAFIETPLFVVSGHLRPDPIITPSAGPNGTISPATVQTVPYGTTPTFTMTPDAGYGVADVLVDGVSVGAVTSYQFPSVIANHTISVTFAVPSLTVTVPTGTESWPSGTLQNLGWSVSSPVSVGQFGVWLVNQTTGTWYDAGYYDATGASSYTPSFSTLGMPAGSYKAVVYYRVDPGQWIWLANATSPGAAQITL